MIRITKWMWKHGVLNNFLAGLFVVLPIAVTLFIVGWMVTKLTGFFGPNTFIGTLMKDHIGGLLGTLWPQLSSEELLSNLSLIIGWGLVLVAIWGFGLFIKIFARHRLDDLVHALLNQIPLISTIYKPISQVVRLLKADEKSDVKSMSVVMCSFGPEYGGHFLALLASKETYRIRGGDYLLVYIPTSPIPMSGGLIFAPCSSVEKVNMPVDDLMKVYFSLGVLCPQVMPKELKAEETV